MLFAFSHSGCAVLLRVPVPLSVTMPLLPGYACVLPVSCGTASCSLWPLSAPVICASTRAPRPVPVFCLAAAAGLAAILSAAFRFPAFPRFCNAFRCPLVRSVCCSRSCTGACRPICGAAVVFRFPTFSVFFQSFRCPFAHNCRSPLSFRFQNFHNGRQRVVRNAVCRKSARNIVQTVTPRLRARAPLQVRCAADCCGCCLPTGAVASRRAVFRPPRVRQGLLVEVVQWVCLLHPGNLLPSSPAGCW